MHLDDIVQHADKFQVSTRHSACMSRQSTAEQSYAQDDIILYKWHSLLYTALSAPPRPAPPRPALLCPVNHWSANYDTWS